MTPYSELRDAGENRSRTGNGPLPGLDILVAVPDEIIRRGLCDMLGQVEGVDAVESCEIPALVYCLERGARRPDVVVISGFGDMRETVAAARLAAELSIKVLVFLDSVMPDVVRAVSEIRADGFLLREDLSVPTLCDTLRRIERAEFPLPAAFGRRLIAQTREPVSRPESRPIRLTPRERNVLELIAEGLSNKQIARRFAISEHGVKRHVANLLAKLNCPNRTHAVTLALRHGLIADPVGRSAEAG